MDIDLAQALYTIRRLPGEQLPQLAVDFIAAGHDTPPLRELAGLNRPTLRDAGALFEQVLSELGRGAMTHGQVAVVIAVDLAKRVVSGELPPHEAAARGASYGSDLDYPPVLSRYAAADDDYECFPDRRAEIDEAVIAYAKQLVAGEIPRAV